MWLSRKAVKETGDPATASSVGEVTIGGASPGAITDAEKRNLLISSPGGYFWRPEAGESVLIIKGDDGSGVAAGVISQDAPGEIKSGEVCVRSGSNELWITRDRGVVIKGDVFIEGALKAEGPVIEYAVQEQGGGIDGGA